MKNLKIFFASFIFGVLTLSFLAPNFVNAEENSEAEEGIKVFPVRIFLFHSVTCPHCHDELEFLEELQEEHSNIEIYEMEVSKDFKNKNLFSQAIDYYELNGGGVPVTVIGDEVIGGFGSAKTTGKKIEDRVLACSDEACNSWLNGKLSLSEITEKTVTCFNEKHNLDGDPSDQGCEGEEETMKIFGWEVNAEKSILALGVVLGLADGINPCMFSVLIFLLTYLVAIGSRKKAIKTGIVFTVTTFVLYFLFMLGIIKVIDVLGVINWAKNIIIVFAFVAGAIMVKDFFFYGKWISLEIPKRYKPTIEKLIKKGTFLSAVLLALFSGLVELPCTSGLPVAYIAIIADKEISKFWPLVVYNLFFVVPLVVIISGVTFAWAKVDKFESLRIKFRKYMRLVAGVILVFLAVALLNNWL